MSAAAGLVGIALLASPSLAVGGVETTLQVFHQQAYDTRIHPAYGAFVRTGGATPLKALLRETVRQLREHPVPAASPTRPRPVDGLSIALEIAIR
jgi:hypothetical protein